MCLLTNPLTQGLPHTREPRRPLPLPASVTGLPSIGRIPGSKAMWVGIFCEFTEFALLFAVYFIARAHNPEAFAAGPGRLSLLAGTGYTLMLLTSGWCVARAVHAMRKGERARCLRWLGAAFVFGLGYPAIKIFELQRNFALGLDGSAGVVHRHLLLPDLHPVWSSVFWGLLGSVVGQWRAPASAPTRPKSTAGSRRSPATGMPRTCSG